MGTTAASDLNGMKFTIGPFTQASRASNAAAATTARIWRAPVACRVDAVQWVPTEADQAEHATNNHYIGVLDAGTDGTGTTVVASHRFTASVASLSGGSIPTTGTTTIGAGDFVSIAYTTMATASSTGKLFAGEYWITVEYV